MSLSHATIPEASPAPAAGEGLRELLRSRAAVLGFAGFWVAFGVLYTVRFYVVDRANPPPSPLWKLVAQAYAVSLSYGVVCLGIWLVAWRFPLASRRWPLHLAAAVAACAGLAAARGLALQPVEALLFGALPAPSTAQVLAGYVAPGLLIGPGFYCAAAALDYFLRYRRRELDAARLAAQLADAELRVLEAELHPRFLFETFALVTRLMHTDVPAADRTLARLSEMLRLTLNRSWVREVALHEELEFVRIFLDIEETRHGGRLRACAEAGPEAAGALVPHLLLHQVVEHVVREGVPDGGLARVEVRATRCGGWLELEVRLVHTSAAGEAPAPARFDPVPAATRARLRQAYGAEWSVEASPVPGGLAVALRLPFRGGEAGEPARVEAGAGAAAASW